MGYVSVAVRSKTPSGVAGFLWNQWQVWCGIRREDTPSLPRQSHFGFDHRIGHFRPLRIMGVAPKLPCPQWVRCFALGQELLGWPAP